jgi:hypothetical protein
MNKNTVQDFVNVGNLLEEHESRMERMFKQKKYFWAATKFFGQQSFESRDQNQKGFQKIFLGPKSMNTQHSTTFMNKYPSNK